MGTNAYKDLSRCVRALRKFHGMCSIGLSRAGMAELVDAGDLKSPGRMAVRVRPPLPAVRVCCGLRCVAREVAPAF